MQSSPCVSLNSRSESEHTPSEEQNHIPIPRDPAPETNGESNTTQTHISSSSPSATRHQMNGDAGAPDPRAPPSGVIGGSSSRPPQEHDGRGPGGPHRPQQPNGWGNYGPPASPAYPHAQQGAQRQENAMLRRSIAAHSAPERLAQRKSSMTQLQQWVNQRRGLANQEDLRR